jgi:hypothetical protein
MKKYLWFTIMAFSLLMALPIVSAEQFCLNNATLRNNDTIAGSTIIIDTNCRHGCDSVLNICMPSDTMQVFIVIGVIFVLLIIVWIIKRVFRL